MNNQNLRFYIQVRVKLGINALEIFNELKTVFSSNSPSLSTIYRWINVFESGSDRIEDLHRAGRPISESTKANIDKVQQVIDDDPWSTYDDIEAKTSLSRGTINRIITECLKLKKVTSRWVPHTLTEQNRQERVRVCQENLAKFNEGKWRWCDVITGDESWFYHRQIGSKQSNASWCAEGEPPRTIEKRGRFEPKTMVTVFFRSSGVVSLSYLDKGKSINNISYVEDCLKPLVTAIEDVRPTLGCKNLKFHHDNARPHVHSSVKTYLKEQNFIIMEHPPYSPDLAPSDFWLFDYIKKRLTTQPNAESLIKQISEIVNSIPKDEYNKTFIKWKERMELCIKNQGNYFEHLIK